MTAPAPAPAETGKTPAVIRWLVVATFTVILNETIMINAIPRLAEDFDVSYNAAQWLSTAFLLTMAVGHPGHRLVPAAGHHPRGVRHRDDHLRDRHRAGRWSRPMFWVLLLARIIQASGTAVMMPLLMTTLMTVVPEHDRGRVMGNVTLAMSVAPGARPRRVRRDAAARLVALDVRRWCCRSRWA